MTRTPTLKSFRSWLETAAPGEQYVYARSDQRRNPPLFVAARLAHEDGKVILFQRPLPHEPGDIRYWEHVAQACSDQALAWLERAAHPAPDPNAWVPIVAPKVFGSVPGTSRKGSGRHIERR